MSKSKIKTTDRRSRWDKLQRDLGGPSAVFAGVLQDTATHQKRADPTDLSLVEIATKNEFGGVSLIKTEAGFKSIKIPPRPFVRWVADHEEKLINAQSRKEYGRILDGKQTREKALNRMGIFLKSRIQNRIEAVKTPPNAPATIARKKSDNPLIDTGVLLNSINYAVEK